MTSHPTEPKLPESLEVVAWRVEFDRRDNAVELWPAEAHGHPPGFGNEVEALVRLTDAESALKARDAEIERLRGDAEWRPIESAPKHSEVLVWREDSGTFIAQLTTPDAVLSERELEQAEFPEDFEEWFSDAYGWQENEERPTLWKPLPQGPSAIDQARATGGEKVNG